MAYLGNVPAEAYSSIDKQVITGDGGTSYTLDHSVANENEIEVFVNNVRQEPSVAYTVSGTALTMTGDVESSDDFYVVFQGKAIQTTSHPEGQDLKARDGYFSGDLGVGVSDPAYTVDVASSGNTQIHLKASGQANGLEIGQLSVDGGSSITATNNNYLKFGTNNTERMRIDSNGAVTTSRASSDGTMLSLKRGTTEVARLDVQSTDNVFFSAMQGGGAGFQLWGSGGTDPIIGPVKEGVSNNGDVQLGRSSERYKNLYLSGEGGSTAAIDVRQGSTKVWANWNGKATNAAARDSYNVSSMADRGTGKHTVNINNDMNNNDYAVGFGGSIDDGVNDSNVLVIGFDRDYTSPLATGLFYVMSTFNSATHTTRHDGGHNTAQVVGDLA